MNKDSHEQSDHLQGYAVGGGNKPPDGKLPTDSPSGEKPKVKRKRKSPAVPWKKPKDMPKRPLSAYNLFFKDERERLLNERKSAAGKDAAKKKRAGGGIGFANLAKTIAAKWNELDPESRAPYEETAAKEKARYDSAVAKWRIEQKEKAAKAKALQEEEEKSSRKNEASPEKHLEGYPGREGETYPPQWFQAGMEHHPGAEGDSSGVPSFVDAMNDESSRSYVSPMSHESSRRRMRASSGGHSAVSSLSPNSASSSARTAPPYYAHSPHYPGQQDPYVRDPRVRGGYARRRMDPYATAASLHMSSTMRDPRSGRSASMPPHTRGQQQHLSGDMDRIQMEVAELRRARNTFFSEGGDTASYPSSAYGGGGGGSSSSQQQHTAHSAPPTIGGPHPGHPSQVHPRSASLPGTLMGSSSRPPSGMNPSPQPTTGTLGGGDDTEGGRARRSSRRSPTEPNEEAVFEASLRSLSENLDDDAISFLTTMRFE